jgi:hypothetical protein
VRATARPLLLAVLACSAVALGIAARDLDVPGLYYDEVIQIEPALWFLRADPAPPEIPGTRSVDVFGRPLPWLTQAYMGALKSQVFVPVLAVAPPSARVVRLATLAIALAGLALAMAFVRQAFDGPTAALTGALLAVDPSFLFTARHDWGSFALGFLLRSAAACAVLSGWRTGSARRLFAGGLFAGLALYNKVDAALPLAAAGAALLIAAPHSLRELGSRPRALAAFAAGALLGVAPLLIRLTPVLALTRLAAAGGAGGGADRTGTGRWLTLQSALDGTYFQRLLAEGGVFARLGEAAGSVATPFAPVLLLAAAALAACLARDLARGRRRPAETFALLAALFTLAGTLLLPFDLRIHHVLNAWPLPQLVVALAVREIWRRFANPLARGAVAVGFGAILLGALRADVATLDAMRATGGKGLWSDAALRLVPDWVGQRVVCLDWGFAIPLRLAAPELDVDDAIWRLRGGARQSLAGDGRSVYLLHEPDYAVFPFGPQLLDAVKAAPPGAVRVQRHPDRTGAPAFVSVRFAGPHRLHWGGGRLVVKLEAEAGSSEADYPRAK